MGAESERICCSAPEKGEEELITAGGHRVDGLRFSLCAQTTLAESSLGSAWGRCELKERLKVMGCSREGANMDILLDAMKPRLLTTVLWDDASAPGTSSKTHYQSTRNFRRREQK